MQPNTWNLKMTPADAPHNTVRGLSDDEARTALQALISGGTDRLTATIARATEPRFDDLAAAEDLAA